MDSFKSKTGMSHCPKDRDFVQPISHFLRRLVIVSMFYTYRYAWDQILTCISQIAKVSLSFLDALWRKRGNLSSWRFLWWDCFQEALFFDRHWCRVDKEGRNLLSWLHLVMLYLVHHIFTLQFISLVSWHTFIVNYRSVMSVTLIDMVHNYHED